MFHVRTLSVWREESKKLRNILVPPAVWDVTCVRVCVYSQRGELTHVGEGVVRQGTDFIVAQVSVDQKVEQLNFFCDTFPNN